MYDFFMSKLPRARSVPPLESGDIIVGESMGVEKEILEQINVLNAMFVIEKPCKSLLERISKQIKEMNPETNIINIKTKEDIKDIKDIQNECKKNTNVYILAYSLYPQIKEKVLEKPTVIFMNIQGSRRRKRIVADAKKKECKFYFVSNIYKIENISKLEKSKIGRILFIKAGFGLARTANAFGRKHETVFVGAPHLKQSGFCFALYENVTTPCIIVGRKEESLVQIEEALSRIDKLCNKHTRSLNEYIDGKKWFILMTYQDLLQMIISAEFEKVSTKTASIFSYDATDRTSLLLAMHQVAKSVVSLFTTEDRGKGKKIAASLPSYGINIDTETLCANQKIRKENK